MVQIDETQVKDKLQQTSIDEMKYVTFQMLDEANKILDRELEEST